MIHNFDWRQAIFDLMANRRIELIVEGEMHQVNITLKAQDGLRMREVASVIGADDFESGMAELMSKADVLKPSA